MTTKKNTAPVAAPVATAAENLVSIQAFEPMIWTADLYETVGKKSLDTLSARAKGYKCQGLLATLLQQPVTVVVNTLTDTILGLPSGTTKQTVVIRDNVAANDPVPAKCQYVDGQWVTEQSSNVRQAHKVAITSAFATLAKRDVDGKDSYSLPADWKGKKLEWKAAPGSKDNGFFAIVDRKEKKEEMATAVASVEPNSPLLTIFAATAKHVGNVIARQLLMPVIEDMISTYRLAIPGKIVAAQLASEKQSAYTKAMAKAKIKEQYAAFLSMGMSENTIQLAMVNEHGNNWKNIAAIG